MHNLIQTVERSVSGHSACIRVATTGTPAVAETPTTESEDGESSTPWPTGTGSPIVFGPVIAGLTQPWNSGAVEGHVNRIKILKRQMFDRAGFHLLHKHVLLA